MFYKKLFLFIWISTGFSLSINAMDMDKVNRLAEMFKAGKSVKSIVNETPAEEAIKVVVPKIEVITVVEEVKVEIPKSIIEKPVVAVKKVKATVTEESLGLRKTDLYSEDAETIGEATTYGKDAAGSSKVYVRAFENAPPMIPHDIEGMLPIKIGNNSCTGCHLPEVAKSMGATAIPASHFASFRPITAIGTDGRITKEGSGVDNTSDLKTVVHALNKLSHARFNCSQCHAPQSDNKPLVGNTFTADFSESGSKKSNLIDVINEGVN